MGQQIGSYAAPPMRRSDRNALHIKGRSAADALGNAGDCAGVIHRNNPR